jgi:outer membrane protein OmpA-like peptidoglycan-associated protein
MPVIIDIPLDSTAVDVIDTAAIISGQQEKIKNIDNYIEYITTVNPEKLNYVKGVQFVMLSDSLRYNKIEQIDENSDYRDFTFLTLMHPSGDIVLQAEYEKELMYLSEVLQKRKDWMVEIRSHTDSRGTDKANKKLSQNRADFISNYLKLLGVKTEQINSMGLGETLLLNHCVDGAPCTEDEHASNRRTELILKKRVSFK